MQTKDSAQFANFPSFEKIVQGAQGHQRITSEGIKKTSTLQHVHAEHFCTEQDEVISLWTEDQDKCE
jgi:hypothetical protein